MEKTYDPKVIEDAQYEYWLKGNYFRSDVHWEREKFSIVIPPPNVTGALHVGHALDLTQPDIIVRWKRMLGKNTLWVPGTDHAGIATQMVVERELAKEGKERLAVGREYFEKRAWQWKEYSHALIIKQIQKLGLSVDWSKERFTMDEGLSQAVRIAFVELYKKGLIYKGEYIVNWCPRCRTAISDLEVKHEQREGQLYYIHYPVKGTSEAITVATTRPETMLGDTAVAVHPDDDRYHEFVGKVAVLPLLKREIPIIADTFVDREFGTGAVKVTPAHDPNDFLAGKRHNLPAVIVIDGEGKMTTEAGPYAGMDRFEARKRIVQDLIDQNLLSKQEKHLYSIGSCFRCGTIVEPLLSTQWFVKTGPLAAPAIRAVEEGRIRFFPEHSVNLYFEWMRNIHDWCISRQLWWGHRIPAWYCKQCRTMQVAVDAPKKCDQCSGSVLEQDPDVLDTWFSSGLWPFSVFGWPQQTPELKYYYPTDLLITGFDIIFFWVARMIMFGLEFMHDVPFREVYIHGLVRDEKGQKMTKSKGNTLDPMELIDEYGADSLRFTLAILSSPTADIPLAPKRIQGYKAFINKLWNSVRFALMKIDTEEDLTPLSEDLWDLGDRWIYSRFHQVAKEINDDLKEYRFDLAANAAYQFLWHEFCDWYIEWIKPHISEDAPHASAKKGLLLLRIGDVLRLLHPFIPYVTEYLWQQLPKRAKANDALIISPYPLMREEAVHPGLEERFQFLMDIISKIRQMRTEMNIEPAKKIHVLLHCTTGEELIREQEKEILLLTRSEKIDFVSGFPAGRHLARGVIRDCEIAIDLAGVLDMSVEKERLGKELRRIEADLQQVERKLANENFLRNAPAEVVEEQKLKFADLNNRKQRTEEHLKVLQ